MARSLKLSGDFAALKRFEDRLRTAPGVLETVSRNMAEAAVDLVKEGFDAATDPYGKKWPPLVLRAGEPLQDTGRLKASYHVAAASKSGFRIASSTQYAPYHQGGTGIYGPKGRPIVPTKKKALRLGKTGYVRRSVKGAPQRKMVPDAGRLPDSWRRTLNDAALEVLEDHFTR